MGHVDLSKPWPLGLAEKRWWMCVLRGAGLARARLGFDRQISVWAQGWPQRCRGVLAVITRYGESDWISDPSLALLRRHRRARAPRAAGSSCGWCCWQFAALYGFIFLGVGLPSLVSTLVKRVDRPGRPEHFDERRHCSSFHGTWRRLDLPELSLGPCHHRLRPRRRARLPRAALVLAGRSVFAAAIGAVARRAGRALSQRCRSAARCWACSAPMPCAAFFARGAGCST